MAELRVILLNLCVKNDFDFPLVLRLSQIQSHINSEAYTRKKLFALWENIFPDSPDDGKSFLSIFSPPEGVVHISCLESLASAWKFFFGYEGRSVMWM